MEKSDVSQQVDLQMNRIVRIHKWRLPRTVMDNGTNIMIEDNPVSLGKLITMDAEEFERLASNVEAAIAAKRAAYEKHKHFMLCVFHDDESHGGGNCSEELSKRLDQMVENYNEMDDRDYRVQQVTHYVDVKSRMSKKTQSVYHVLLVTR